MAISKSTLCADEMVEAEGATFFRSTTRQDVRATATSRRRNVAPRINVNLPYSSVLLQIYGRKPTIKDSQGHFWLIVRSLQGPLRYKESRFCGVLTRCPARSMVANVNPFADLVTPAFSPLTDHSRKAASPGAIRSTQPRFPIQLQVKSSKRCLSFRVVATSGTEKLWEPSPRGPALTVTPRVDQHSYPALKQRTNVFRRRMIP